MARGGARPGAGRKKDPKNDLIRELTATIKGGAKPPRELLPAAPVVTDEVPDPTLTPLDYLLRIVRDPTKPETDRVRAAALALPFCHAKPGEKGKKGEKEHAAKSAASSGKFATPLPPTPLRAVG
jgi:phage terminase small subunit